MALNHLVDIVKDTAEDENWSEDHYLAAKPELLIELCKARWRVLCKGQRLHHRLKDDGLKTARRKVLSCIPCGIVVSDSCCPNTDTCRCASVPTSPCEGHDGRLETSVRRGGL